MARYNAKALRWVHQNRQPVQRCVPIGKLAGDLLEQQSLSMAKWLGELQRAIAEGTDGDFRRRCSLGGLRAGTLTILVDDPSWVRGIRDEWLVPLLELLKGQRRRFGVSSIRFVEGRGDLTFADPGDIRGGLARAAVKRTDRQT